MTWSRLPAPCRELASGAFRVRIISQTMIFRKFVIVGTFGTFPRFLGVSIVLIVQYVPILQIYDVIFAQQDLYKSQKTFFRTQSLLCVNID